MRYLLAFLLFMMALLMASDAFVAPPSPTARQHQLVLLFMGKGLNRARNKQAEMLKKMKLAKQQNSNKGDSEDSQSPPPQQQQQQQQQQVEQDNQEEYDRLLFAELLAKNPPPATNEPVYSQSESKTFDTSSSTNTKPKIKAKAIKKKQRAQQQESQQQSVNQVENDNTPLQQGDTAKRRHFECLVDVNTSKPLGAIQAAQLVPWVPPFLSYYLVVLADPRKQSSDLRLAVQYLTSNVPPDILSQTIVIGADSSQEMKSWMKRASVKTPIRMFSDSKLEWMNIYSAVTEKERWSMSVYIIDTDGTIQSHQRQVDPSHVSQIVTDMVGSIQEET